MALRILRCPIRYASCEKFWARGWSIKIRAHDLAYAPVNSKPDNFWIRLYDVNDVNFIWGWAIKLVATCMGEWLSPERFTKQVSVYGCYGFSYPHIGDSAFLLPQNEYAWKSSDISTQATFCAWSRIVPVDTHSDRIVNIEKLWRLLNSPIRCCLGPKGGEPKNVPKQGVYFFRRNLKSISLCPEKSDNVRDAPYQK